MMPTCILHQNHDADTSGDRFTGDGGGNKIVLKNYKRVPMVSNQGDFIAITAGDSCEDVQGPDDAKTIAPSGGNTLGHALALAIPVALTATGIPGYASAALGFLSLGSIGRFPLAVAQTDSLKPLDDFVDESTACNQVPITVDIYVDETVNELVMRDAQSGDFEICPPESTFAAPENIARFELTHLTLLLHKQVCTGSTIRMSSVGMRDALVRKRFTHVHRTLKVSGRKVDFSLRNILSCGTEHLVLRLGTPPRTEPTGSSGVIPLISPSLISALGEFSDDNNDVLMLSVTNIEQLTLNTPPASTPWFLFPSTEVHTPGMSREFPLIWPLTTALMLVQWPKTFLYTLVHLPLMNWLIGKSR